MTNPYRYLLERALRGQPELVAQRTRIGFAYAIFGLGLCVFYLVFFGALGVYGALPVFVVSAALDLLALGLFTAGRVRAPHVLVTLAAAIMTFYFHFALGPELHVADFAFAQVVYPFIIFDRRSRRELVACTGLWLVVIAGTHLLALPGWRLPIGGDLSAILAPQVAGCTFIFAFVQMWFFDQERARARDAAALELQRTESEEREAAKRYESTLTALAERDEVERELLEAARRAGMAHVTDRALHALTAALNAFGASRAALKTSLEALQERKLPQVTSMLTRALAAGDAPRFDKVADYLEQLSKRWQSAVDDASTELSQIEDASARVARTISVQQGAARFRSEQQTVELEELVSRALDLAVGEAAGWTLEVEPVVVCCDTSLVREVLLVLATNAVEAVDDERSRRAASSRASGASTSGRPPPVTLSARVDDGALHVVLEDSGCGFEAGFNPFEAGRSTKGANRGFGLHWAANSILAARGKITLESDGPGRGARAGFVLPLGIEGCRCAA